MTPFTAFDLDPKLLKAITEMGYSEPTPIQEKAIPVVLEGKDVMGAAQTGTGKTAGFGLPMLQRVIKHANTSMSPARHPVRALVLTPTRELADQVNQNLTAYAKYTGLRVGVVYGGVDFKPQAEMARKGVEVLTATPGRLLDHIEGKTLNLSQVEVVVLDEADRMLDMGFLPDISRILTLLPKGRQSLMFSATFSPEIKKLAQSFLNDNPLLIEVARQNQTNDNVTQRVLLVEESDKTDVLIDLLKQQGQDGQAMRQVIVFVNSKMGCRRLARTLSRVGVNAGEIHGDKTQEERLVALEAFKNGGIQVLVATDVAARGLDIKELPFVINYDVPYVAEDYVHRIGRTGRAGSTGVAIMLVTKDDLKNVGEIEKLTKQSFKPEPTKPLSRQDRAKLRRQHPRDEAQREQDEEAFQQEAIQRARAYAPPTYRSRDPIFSTPYRERSYRPEPVFKMYEPEHRQVKQTPVLLTNFPKEDPRAKMILPDYHPPVRPVEIVDEPDEPATHD